MYELAKDISVERHLKEWADLIKRLKLLPQSPMTKWIDYRISRIEHLIQINEVKE